MNNDLLKGDHSFKKWWDIMWNVTGYIKVFLSALIANILFIIFQHDDFQKEGVMGAFYGIITFLALIKVIIAYKGFYQKWNDLKNGKSR